MKNIELIRELEKYPVFNLKVLKDIIKKENNYTKLVAYRLKKAKLILEIEKNKYTTNKDALVIASSMVWPSYLSCWTALRYHNLTEQLPKEIFLITPKSRKKKIVKFNGTQIFFIKTKPEYFFGYNKENYKDADIFIADKEKTIIDTVLFKKASFSEISEIVKNNMENLDFSLMTEYLIKINNKNMIKRFGFLFDSLNIESNKLRRFINYNYIILDYAVLKKGKKNKKWRVIENVKT